MARPDQQPVPRGPLAVRWHSCGIGPVRAGALHTAAVELENAGTASWRSLPHSGIWLGYHWLDRRGNPLVWEGLRTQLPRQVEPGERLSVEIAVRGPLPSGPYRLALDLVEEGRFWLAELGNVPLELDLEVGPRIERRLAVRMSEPHAGTERALAAQAEPLVPEDGAEAIAYLARGCLPAPDWSRRVLDAHAEGYAVVAGSVEPAGSLLARRRLATALRPWAPGSGRVPGFSHPYLCPSVVRGLELAWLPEIEGLPAAERPADRLWGEPWLYDGRIALALRR